MKEVMVTLASKQEFTGLLLKWCYYKEVCLVVTATWKLFLQIPINITYSQIKMIWLQWKGENYILCIEYIHESLQMLCRSLHLQESSSICKVNIVRQCKICILPSKWKYCHVTPGTQCKILKMLIWVAPHISRMGQFPVISSKP